MHERAADMEFAISASGLTKKYGDRNVVDGLSFNVEWGRVTGFLGRNGAGKSTTLKMLLGLAHPTGGSGLIAGRAYDRLDAPGSVVGALLETQQFHPLRRAREHLAIYATSAGIPRARVDVVLEQVGLTDAAKKKVGEYSLGMQQRLGLATALLAQPKILILDEPANGLDPAGMRWLRRFIQAYAQEGHAVFVSSHQLTEISQMADEVVVIDEGRLVTHAPMAELMQRSEARTLVRTDEPERLRDLLVAEGLAVDLTAHDAIAVAASSERVGRIAGAAHITLLGLRTEEGSLEDIFLDMTGSEGIR